MPISTPNAGPLGANDPGTHITVNADADHNAPKNC